MPNRKMFPDSIIPMPASPGVTAHGLTVNAAESHHRAEKMDISFSLSLPPALEKELEERVDKGDVISPDEMKTKYSVDAATANALQTWLKSEGFTITEVAPDRIIADAMVRPALRVVSISLGLGEHQMVPAEVTTEEAKFTRLAALGVNVFVSTGDDGSNPNGQLQASWMSTSPHVVAVGGTSLRLTQGGQVAAETGWAGSGGGKSIFFSRPSWQNGPGVPAGNQRTVPDVGMTADPNEGGIVYLNGVRQQYGGTSWSAPVWAALCALINEARKAHQKPPLSMLNPLIYPLNGSNCFRDILIGSNGAYHCGPHYDLVTGIGTPDVKQLVTKLG